MSRCTSPAGSPERVRGLVLAGASTEPAGLRAGAVPRPRLGRWRTFDGHGLETANRWFFRTRYGPAIADPIVAGGFWASGGAEALRCLAGHRFKPELAAYPGPSLILNGSLDLLFRLGQRGFLAVAQDGRSRAPAAGHAPLEPGPAGGVQPRRSGASPTSSRRPDVALAGRSDPGRPGGLRRPARYTRPVPPNPLSRGSMRVRKAVFPAAGWGTRFLPATKAQPKEMLPLVDKPIIQYAVEEAVAAGIEQVIIVTSSQKRAIEDHFDLSYELEHLLEEKGDIEMLRQVRHISDLAQVAYVRQKEQLGLGHAVLMAKDLIGHEPFAVILPDDVVVGDRPCIGQLIHAYNQTHSLGRGGHGGPERGHRPLRRHRRRSRPTIRSTTAGSTASPRSSRSRTRPTRHRTWPSSAATC